MLLHYDYRKKVFFLIAIFFLLRIITASVLELGNDEAYYWLYSQRLQWNYFDHPPMIAIWVRFFTLNGWLDNYEGMVRAGSVVSCAFSTWFIFRAVTLIKDERTGWFAACLFNASLYAGMVAGVLTMPDSPQLFFWTLCLWQIAKLINNDRDWRPWLLFGISAGLCIMSKVHGIFIWTGMGLFILARKREWLRRPVFYLALFLSLLIVSPVWFWNIHYDFVTWQFHSARVDIRQAANGKDSFWVELLQQALVNNPFNFLLILSALYFSASLTKKYTALSVYNFIALPFILSLVIISIFRDIWFHWTGPAFTTLIPIAAVRLSNISRKPLFPGWLKAATAFFVIALLAWPLAIFYFPGTYGSKDRQTLGKGDITLDKYGWKEAGESFASFYEKESVADGLSQAPVVCPSWWGAHIEYYFARPVDAPVIGLGNVQMLHQYAWLNKERVKQADMDTAYCIVASVEDTASSLLYESYYKKNELLDTIPVYRSGELVAKFFVRRLTGWKGDGQMLVELSQIED